MIEYEIFTSLIFFLCAFYKFNKGKSIDISHLCCFLFAAYIIAVFIITDIGTIFEGFENGVALNIVTFNVHPFSRHIYMPSYFANVLMFVPFGFLASIIERQDIGVVRAFLEGLGFSLVIELSQLLNDRYTDVDDLIMNTAGALIGYILYKLIFKKRFPKGGKPRFEAFTYMAVMFLGHFLLFDESIFLKIFH